MPLSNNIDDQDPWDEFDKKPRKSKFILYGFLAILILAGSYVYYKKDKQVINAKIPLIKASYKEFKEKPYNPGGMVVDNMDKTIYDNFSHKPIAHNQEKLLPSPEEPIDRNKFFSTKETSPEKTSLDKKPAPTEAKKNIIKDAKEAPQVVNKALNRALIPSIQKNKTIEKGYMLQLAAFKSHKVALVASDEIKKKYTKLIKSYKINIDKKDIEYNKQFYRLQIGPIESESEARLLCKKLKNEGQDCMVIKP